MKKETLDHNFRFALEGFRFAKSMPDFTEEQFIEARDKLMPTIREEVKAERGVKE